MDKYRKLTKEIVDYLCETDMAKKQALLADILSNYVSRSNSGFGPYLVNLDNSMMKDFILQSFLFFEKEYFNYLAGRKPSPPYKDKNGNDLETMKEIHDSYKDDVFFSKFDQLYSTFLKLNKLKKWDNGEMKFQTLSQHIRNHTLICPFCQSKNIEYTEADHFLPKKYYPILSIFQENLIGTCKYCNSKGIKGDTYVDVPILHPYKDGPNLLANYISFEFQGIDRPCKVDFDSSDEKVVNYEKVYKITERFQNQKFWDNFSIIWSGIIETTTNAARSQGAHSRQDIGLILHEKIDDRKYLLVHEKSGYASFYCQMLDTVDDRTKRQAIVSISMTLRKKV